MADGGGGGNGEHLPRDDHPMHVSHAGVEGGACLFHVEGTYKDNSCSYRWQGKHDPRASYTRVYRNYPLRTGQAALARRGIVGRDHVNTMQRITRSGNTLPQEEYYSDTLRLPEERGDWDLDGPKRGRTLPSPAKNAATGWGEIGPGQNFTTAYWPYWNNAHHLIPKALFRKRVAQDIEDVAIRELVQAGLFRATYNVNHYVNVIFLPMDEEVGQVLHLPRHLTLNGEADVHRKDYTDHVTYTGHVRTGLNSVVRSFEREAGKAAEKACDAKKTIRLAKRKLERISEQCFRHITAFGRASPGKSLNDIGPVVFEP